MFPVMQNKNKKPGNGDATGLSSFNHQRAGVTAVNRLFNLDYDQGLKCYSNIWNRE
jgi:hypothetical protein